MQPVQHIVPDFLALLLRAAPLSNEKLGFAWRSAVGAAIARVSTVRLTAEGTIEVTCGDDHWRREIRRSTPMIKQRLITLLGTEVVKQVKVTAGTPRPRKV